MRGDYRKDMCDTIRVMSSALLQIDFFYNYQNGWRFQITQSRIDPRVGLREVKEENTEE